MSRTGLVVLATAVLLWCCSQQNELNKFSDPILQEIADFQDRRLTDSLYQFLSSEDPRYRAEASLAFGSVQDTAASQALGNLVLEDSNAQVRLCAAFALGQTGGVAAVNALIPAMNDPNPVVAMVALEALGKSVGLSDLNVLKSYSASDTMDQMGLARAFYRIGLRKLADSAIIYREIEFLSSNQSESTRLAAAQFFDRVPAQGRKFVKALAGAALHDPSVAVRMASAGALRHSKNDSVLIILRTVLHSEKDYRVRVNAARSLRVFPFEKVSELLKIALKDSNDQVSIAASEAVLSVVKEKDKIDFFEIARSASNARVKANLYEAMIIAGDNFVVAISELMAAYLASTDDYQKAAMLPALSRDPTLYKFIADELMRSKSFIVKTTAAQGLTEINHAKDFSAEMRTHFAALYKNVIADGDPGVIGIIATALGDSILGYRNVIHDFTFLHEARAKLHLPKDIESLQPLDDAIAFLEGKKQATRLKNPYNHPIDWNLVETIRRDQQVLVKTALGDITLRLLVDEAPGSVANFVQLINQHYFDGRYVHRVVPNFVLQTGCNRGDGFGSEDYSIRSEFSMRKYTTGSVGYASAGKDTEGTQWFITHSATPHLDGRYSIFAEVVEGMEIAHRIGVGDKINSVSLIND